jgi:hypothetical protein
MVIRAALECHACGWTCEDVRDAGAYLGIADPVCCQVASMPPSEAQNLWTGRPPDMHAALGMEIAGQWWELPSGAEVTL